METEEFNKGVKRLLDLAAAAGPTAIMCAEAVWWRCHRSLVSDYLKVRGIEVMHILDANKTEPHPYTSAARIANGKLSYERRIRYCRAFFRALASDTDALQFAPRFNADPSRAREKDRLRWEHAELHK